MKYVDYLFNWKKYPASVFILAAPLAIIGFGSIFLLAILQWKWNSDPWYMVIFMAGMILFGFALWPIRKPLIAALSEKKD